MKAAFKALLCLAVVLAVGVIVKAEDEKKKDDKKEVVLKGTLGCGKCVFKCKDCKVCANAIQVKDGDKEVLYIIDDGGKKQKYHSKICTGKKKGSVTGVVTAKPTDDKPGKIKPSKDGVKFEDD
jgi:hypothetical protein